DQRRDLQWRHHDIVERARPQRRSRINPSHQDTLMLRRLTSASLATCAALAVAVPAFAQDFRWSGSAAAGSEVSVSNVTGNVTVPPLQTGRVEVLGTKRGSGRNYDRIKADVQQTSRGIAICVLYDENSYCDDNGNHSNSRGRWNDDDNWGNARMDLQVAIPN